MILKRLVFPLKNKVLVFLLVFLLTFNFTIQHNKVDAAVETIAVETFLYIAKALGYTALTAGAGYSTYDSWNRYAPENLQSELIRAREEGTGIYASRALLESIQGFLSGGGAITSSPSFSGFPNYSFNYSGQSVGYRIFESDQFFSEIIAVYSNYIVIRTSYLGYTHQISHFYNSGIFTFSYVSHDFLSSSVRVYFTARYGHSNGSLLNNNSSWSIPFSSLVSTTGVLSPGVPLDSPTWKKRESDGKYGVPWFGFPDMPSFDNPHDGTRMPDGYVDKTADEWLRDWLGDDTSVDNPDADIPWDKPIDIPSDGTIIGTIVGVGTAIGNAIRTGINTFTKAITSVFAVPAEASRVNIDFSPLQGLGLMNKFPFSIPWDMYNSVASLSAGASAPVFDFEYMGQNINFDFKRFDFLAAMMRYFIYLLFVVGLIGATRSRIGAGS